ncbi:MAG: M15 family metallopeptidase [Erysipelotrichaceae bacterium]|nr:M15 family metallopeptidase [Erysipelotrichaceae bacterium]
MKLLLIILLMLNLCSCQKSREDLLAEKGFQENEIQEILGLSEENQERFLNGELEKNALKFITAPWFKEEKLDEYLSYEEYLSNYEWLDTKKVIEMVNNETLNETYIKKLNEIYGSDYYIPKNENLYLSFMDAYPSIREMMEIVNTKRYKELYSDITQTDLSKGYLMLINKYYQLPADYEPDDLVYVESYLGKGMLREAVYEAYKLLYADAKALGYNLQIVSAYRSYDYQKGLYQKYLNYDPREIVDTYSARPGHSEHQSGLCMDVSIPGYSLDNFYLTEASRWLAENCWKYGFIIRYPDDKTDITGYQGEPWQLRYVGKETAEDVYKRGITYDEYYACFVEE